MKVKRQLDYIIRINADSLTPKDALTHHLVMTVGPEAIA